MKKEFTAPKVTSIGVSTEQMIAASKPGIVLPDPVYKFKIEDFPVLEGDHDAYNTEWQNISWDPRDIMYNGSEYVERGTGLGFIWQNFWKTYQYIGCRRYTGETNGQFIYGQLYHVYINSSDQYYYKPCDEY